MSLLPKLFPESIWSWRFVFKIEKSLTVNGSTFNWPVQIPGTDATVWIIILLVLIVDTSAKAISNWPGMLKLTRSPTVVIPGKVKPEAVTVETPPEFSVIDAIPIILAVDGIMSAVKVLAVPVIPKTDLKSEIPYDVKATAVLPLLSSPSKTIRSPIWKSPCIL